MLYGLLLTLFIFLCFFIILIVLVQKSRSSMGVGGLGGSTQMLFGGSGGQDLFQKVTWVCVALFMLGSLALAIMNTKEQKNLSYNIRPRAAAPQPAQAPAQEPATPATEIDAQAPIATIDAVTAENVAQPTEQTQTPVAALETEEQTQTPVA